ncbi:MAG: GNAT family N-acetyltransferase [Polyangiales bacterium]
MVLTDRDAAHIEAFLSGYQASSMFLRSNLRRAGVTDRGQPHGGTWVGLGDPIESVAFHGWNGIVIAQCPTRVEDAVREVVARSGRAVTGLLGPWAQVESARAALGMLERPTRVCSREVLFSLRLDALTLPEALVAGRVTVRRATARDHATLAAWRRDYEVEMTAATPGPELDEKASRSIAGLLDDGAIFVAEEGDAPVAMSTFNARLPDVVQIGGVWTPRDLRSRGRARSCVAGSLRLARGEGVASSILFTGASNAAAQRAYRAIGFEAVGDYGVLLFA